MMARVSQQGFRTENYALVWKFSAAGRDTLRIFSEDPCNKIAKLHSESHDDLISWFLRLISPPPQNFGRACFLVISIPPLSDHHSSAYCPTVCRKLRPRPRFAYRADQMTVCCADIESRSVSKDNLQMVPSQQIALALASC
jgi:hypothetical protein